MESLVSLINQNGLGVVICALFLWDWFANKTEIRKVLVELQRSNRNIEKSLDLVTETNAQQAKQLEKQYTEIKMISQTIEKL